MYMHAGNLEFNMLNFVFAKTFGNIVIDIKKSSLAVSMTLAGKGRKIYVLKKGSLIEFLVIVSFLRA